MPSASTPPTQSYWLTVDAVSYASDEQKHALGTLPYLIKGDDMVVNTSDFSKQELLDYAQIWLIENGFPILRLVEGSLEDFQGSNPQAESIEIAKQCLHEIES